MLLFPMTRCDKKLVGPAHERVTSFMPADAGCQRGSVRFQCFLLSQIMQVPCGVFTNKRVLAVFTPCVAYVPFPLWQLSAFDLKLWHWYWGIYVKTSVDHTDSTLRHPEMSIISHVCLIPVIGDHNHLVRGLITVEGTCVWWSSLTIHMVCHPVG